MANVSQSNLAANRILLSLPREEVELLLLFSQKTQLALGHILAEPGEPIAAVCFPIDAAISMLTVQVDRPQTVDVALIGNEGCYGSSVVQGSIRSPSMFMVEISGTVIEVDTSALLQALPRLTHLRAALDAYNYLLTRLIVISAACSQFHSGSQRDRKSVV